MYSGRVHPRVLVPGVLWLGLACLILALAAHSGGHASLLLNGCDGAEGLITPLRPLCGALARWQALTPNIALEIKVVALGTALWGFSKLMEGWLLIETTELVVTTQRVIAKTGIMTVTTSEMDKRRIAAITIDQSFFGQLMGYGHIRILGFTSSIGGLPVIVKPHMIDKYVMLSA